MIIAKLQVLITMIISSKQTAIYDVAPVSFLIYLLD